MPDTIDVQYFTNRWLDFNGYSNDIHYLSHENNLVKVGNNQGYELFLSWIGNTLVPLSYSQ